MASESSSFTPADLLKRSPPSEMKPCPQTRPGSGSPAAMSIAGQITAWKRVMSLPTTWTSAGQDAPEPGKNCAVQ